MPALVGIADVRSHDRVAPGQIASAVDLDLDQVIAQGRQVGVERPLQGRGDLNSERIGQAIARDQQSALRHHALQSAEHERIEPHLRGVALPVLGFAALLDLGGELQIDDDVVARSRVVLLEQTREVFA